ncbi:MAG: PhoX family phosphatase [Gammaproteobacteria bacterium]
MPTRRDFIRYLSVAAALPTLGAGRMPAPRPSPTALRFEALHHAVDAHHHLPRGYRAQVLLRWGDRLFGADTPFSAKSLDPATQARSFGYNNDFIAYFPYPPGSASSTHGLLCVNHEYTHPHLMWPGLDRGALDGDMDAQRTAVELAAIGHSVVEIRFIDGAWQVVPGAFNRRLTAQSGVDITGPAAGHSRLRTSEDPTGTHVAGILNPCGGGKTPWGTVLIAEENFHVAFSGETRDAREARNHARYGVGGRRGYPWWGRYHSRYRLDREVHEANRYGWVVELDPYAPAAAPRKLTALGRFKHEAADCVLAADGRVVVYSGDDAPFEYLYRFVSRRRYRADQPAANRALLDDGELAVARFHADGSLEWVALRHGHGPLTAANGFADQGDILIETRRAADLLGATRLDRPEDVETNPLDGCVYAMLTNNTARTAATADAANPRAHNRYGHILRLLPPGAPGTSVDHAADEFEWSVFALMGNPDEPAQGATYPGSTAGGGWLANPDNCAFDPAGRLWIATDQGANWRATGYADGLWAWGQDGARGAVFKRFFRAPVGAEVCGPEFTPDGRTLFLAVQHPGADGLPGTGYDNPATRWPDFDPDLPPRPAVLAIRRDDGGSIGD